MILEGLVTTQSAAGRIHVAPMGPRIQPDSLSFLLRPFPTSETYRNLVRHSEGVLHVSDDVLLLARAAVGRLEDSPPHRPAEVVNGFVLTGACRAHEFCVRHIDTSEERVRINCDIVHSASLRDFYGFNRGKHAVVEAAILATRIHLLPLEQIAAEFARLEVLVTKTGGPQEAEAFAFLQRYVEERQKERT